LAGAAKTGESWASAAQFLARHSKLCCSKIAPKDARADCEAQMPTNSRGNI
jgi:hypothetical protein